MKGEKRKKLLFVLAAVIVLITTAWHIFHNFTSYPYGIRVRFDPINNRAIVQSVEEGGPAHVAGLRAGDILLRINDYTINVLDADCRECFVRELRTGSLQLRVMRQGEVIDMLVEGGTIEIRLQFFAYLGIGLLYMLMGTWVFFARPNYSAASAWGFFAILMGGFVVELGTVRPPNQEFFFLIVSILIIGEFFFATAAGLHFALIFPKPGVLAEKRWVIPTVYIIPSVLQFGVSLILVVNYFFEGYWENLKYLPSIIGVLVASFMIIYFGLIIITLTASYLATVEITEKRRMRAIIFGTSIPLGLMLLILFLALALNIYIPAPSLVFAFILASIPITYFYAIVRHRAMQMELILKRGLVYSLVTGAVLLLTGLAFIAVFGVMLLFQDILPSLGRKGGTFYRLATDENVQKFTIAVWSVAVGATFGMLKNHIQQFVDKRFYRERYNYREALRKLSLVLEQTHDREKMMDIVISNAEEMVHPRSVAIVLITDDDGAVVEKATPEALEQIILKPDSARALRESLTDGLKFIGLREIDEGVVKEAELVHTAFARLGADICLPLHVDKRFLGFIMLGMKRSESSYNLEDIELLRLLADQAAHGIVHIDLAVEAAEKEKLRRELEIGRRMQQSLLPLSPPKVAGLDVAAINLPAMEVGGDFFTFVEYNKGKLGVIAGDIVGKGVAGALRMAATISSLRLIAEESASVSESMQRLNRYLVKNSDERSFAAVLFTLVDISKREMRWCNGGFPDPVFIPIRGKIRYLENEEYPLPPGASANSAYVESSMKLKPGDTVVLVSDGVVEARPANQDDEQFGYERLLDFFEMNRKRSLEDMIEELKNTLYDYRGSSGFEDDVTVVAIRLNKSGKTS